MIRRLLNWLQPPHLDAQLHEAEHLLDESRERLAVVEEREPRINATAQRLARDRYRNNYGPTIARALGGKP